MVRAEEMPERQAGSRADRVSILIVDDHPVVLLGMVRLLETEPDFDIVGAADNCRDACQQVEAKRPDIVLSDLEMGDDSGFGAFAKLCLDNSEKMIVFSAYTDDHHIMNAIQLGVRGYVTKGSAHGLVLDAIRIVAKGGTYLDPEVASRVTARLFQRAGRQHADPDRLTEREFAVLHRIAAGKSNREIGKELHISERTVKFHCSSVFSKLGAKNRTEAVRIAAKQRLVCF